MPSQGIVRLGSSEGDTWLQIRDSLEGLCSSAEMLLQRVNARVDKAAHRLDRLSLQVANIESRLSVLSRSPYPRTTSPSTSGASFPNEGTSRPPPADGSTLSHVDSSEAATSTEGKLQCKSSQLPLLPRPPASAFPIPPLPIPSAPDGSSATVTGNVTSIRTSTSISSSGVTGSPQLGLGDQRGQQSAAPLTAFFLSTASPLAAALSAPSSPALSTSGDDGPQGSKAPSVGGEEQWQEEGGQDDGQLDEADVAGWLVAAAAAGWESDESPLEFRPGMAATPVVSVQSRAMQGLLPFSHDSSRR